jgi:hypothetical protein
MSPRRAALLLPLLAVSAQAADRAATTYASKEKALRGLGPEDVRSAR